VGLGTRVDRYQRRHGWLGLPLAVLYKAVDDRIPHLAALIAYYAFVSLFPLLLLLFSALGFFLEDNPALRENVIDSTLREFPVMGEALRENVDALHGSGVALAIGIVGTLYGGLGVMQAAQTSFNQIYGVPRHQQPNPIRSRLRSLGLLALLGTGVLVATVVAGVASTGNEVSERAGGVLRALAVAVATLAGVGLFSAAFQLLTACDLRFRQVVVGGVVTALIWQLLQLIGAPYVSGRLAAAGAVYGVFAVVLVALAWIYLQALALVLAAEINVVLHKRLWPRALAGPFTEDVDLTDADRRAYAMYAKTQTFKGFQSVEIDFTAPEGRAPRGGS
jgi:membrane protein